MKTDLKSVLMRARSNLAQDALGLGVLVLMLFVGLHLPQIL